MTNVVFYLKGSWQILFNGIVPRTTWQEKGSAEAQLALFESGYSELTYDGIIVHPGAKRRSTNHPFVSTLGNGPCSSCGRIRGDNIHKGDW